MIGFLRAGLRPLRHYADFKGRSRRTEVVAFWLLLSLATFLVWFLVYRAHSTAGHLAAIGLQCATVMPQLTLLIRRLHDQAWNNWWLLLLLPAYALGFWRFLVRPFGLDFLAPFHLGPDTASTVQLICTFVMVTLLFERPEKRSTRYGPDPRRFEPGDPDY